MKTSQLTLASVLAVGVAVAAADAQAQAKKKPEKYACDTVEVISHASPGGGTDTTARMMMIRARRHLNTDMIVVYKRGGQARAAHEYFKKRPADGCTVLAITQSHFNTIAEGRSPITVKDMAGIARAMDDPMLITVHKDSQFKTIDDLIKASKAKRLNWAGGGILSTDHIAIDNLARAGGVQYKFVPYGSAGAMVTDLLAQKVDAAPLNVSEAVGQIEEGNFVPLLVLSKTRLKDYPDVPSTGEKGWDVTASTTRGYVVRKGTPPDRVARLQKAMAKAMKHKVFAGYLAGAGLSAADSVIVGEQWDQQLAAMEASARDAVARMKNKKK
ncbi:MAG: tripartite tricarboxylate transporter substrate binding protein [Alphaproteobacteria bacterium]|nr:tripartite tricarboxylate transporter substrate binding protein [Alphaproteobacteria bacterium]